MSYIYNVYQFLQELISQTIFELVYLISIIPPAHDPSVFCGVLPQPIVSLAEVVQDLYKHQFFINFLKKLQIRVTCLEPSFP